MTNAEFKAEIARKMGVASSAKPALHGERAYPCRFSATRFHNHECHCRTADEKGF